MVTSKTFARLMNISQEIARKAGTDPEVAVKVLEAAREDVLSRRRRPAPQPPEGGISQSAAARKYKIEQSSISRWVKHGYIPVILRTNKEVYIDESKLIEIINIFNEHPGQGVKTVKRKLVSF